MGAQMGDCFAMQCCEGGDLGETLRVSPSLAEAYPSPVLLGSMQRGEIKEQWSEPMETPIPTRDEPTTATAQPQEPVSSSEVLTNIAKNELNVADVKPVAVAASTVEQILDESGRLTEALKQGRYVAASRELKKLEDKAILMPALDASSRERLKRIEGRYEAGMKLIQSKPGDFRISEENAELNLSWGLKLEGDRLVILQETKFPSLSLVDCCMLEFERDLENHLTDDDIKTTMLSSPLAHECTWHRLAHIKDVGSKIDDVVVESALDALDEPCKSVIGMRYSPSAYDASAKVDPSGNAIPPPEKGRDRPPYVFFFTKLTPSSNGVIRTEVSEAQIPSTVAKILGWMPGFVLKKLFRKMLENQAKYAVELVQKRRAVLDERLQAAPRSVFYQQICTHEASMAK